MKKVLVALLVIIVAAGVFLYYPRSTGTDAASAATIAVFHGDVDSQRAGAEFQPALDGDVVASGDLVRANSTGRAVLAFFDGSSVTLEPGALLKVVSLARTSGDGIQAELEQVVGRTWTSVQKLKTPDSKFQLKTPNSTAVVRGTAFETTVEVVNGETVTTVRTTEGEVVVQAVSGGPPVTVGADQQTQVTRSGPASPPAAQPPTPRLRFTAPAGVGFVVTDPRGLRCGSTGGASQRQIPGCTVAGTVVEVSDVVAGTWSMMLTAAAAVPAAVVQAEGLRGTTRDFAATFTRALAVGDLVRTTLPVRLGAGGALAADAFAAPELVTSVCGAEAAGRIFSSGSIAERLGGLSSFAAANRGQPAAFVVTDRELTAEADAGVGQLGGSPVKVTGLAVTVDGGGVHLAARATAGPIEVPARAEIVAGTTGGKLLFRVRGLDLGAVPPALTAQLIAQVDRSLTDVAASIPLRVDRVSFRAGCLGILGTTLP